MYQIGEQRKEIKQLLKEANYGEWEGDEEWYFNERFISFLKNYILEKDIREEYTKETTKSAEQKKDLKKAIEYQENGYVEQE